MPMIRYDVRNEHSLANHELYQAADKDDSEALLVGVAMAGLVGLLRQLGDLAEFAAEIFHNLHEEVVATAARGHGLMVRVQQLEAEIPSFEKAFLSQTDRSSFFYHAGVDWHPNMRTDQNLVTQGDLPRFVMDSYEECREPPRLFLLDKFDVAGAGACLKRYTDPSFYKVESIDMPNSNFLRERKILKAKRKGSRWKNQEVTETLPESHAKLHELFMEEHAENRVGKSSSRVKLKRRLNGYPFDARTGKSYMEKILRSSSSDHEVLNEVSEVSISTSSMLITNEQDEPKSEITEDRQLSPGRLSVKINRSPSSSPIREKAMRSNDIPGNDMISRPHPSTEMDVMSSTQETGSCESVIGVDAVSKREDSLLGYHSDDVSSEIDYVDAPSRVETEMDTDSEMRAKGGSTSSHIDNQSLGPEGEEHHDSGSDSQSIIYSLSEDVSSSPKKEMSNHSSESSSISAENSLLENTSVEKFPCADIREIEVVDSLSDQKNAESERHSETMVHEGAFTGFNAVSIQRSEFEHADSMPGNDSPPIVADSGSVVVRKDTLSVRQVRNAVSSPYDEEKKVILIADHHSSAADSDSEKGDDCPDPSGHPLSEADCKNMCASSATDPEPLPGMVSLHNECSCELDQELLELPEDPTVKCRDMSQNNDETKQCVFNDDAKDEMEISTFEWKLGKTSLSSGRDNDVGDNHTSSITDNLICTEESNSMHMVDSPALLQANLSVHGRYDNTQEKTIVDDTAVPLTSDSFEGSPQPEESVHCSSHDAPQNFEELGQNSSFILEEIEVPAEISCGSPKRLKDISETPFSNPYKFDEAIGNSCSLSEMHEEPLFSSLPEVPALDESGEENDKEDSEERTSALPGISSDFMLDNDGLALNSEKIDVENTHTSEDLGVDEPENDENVLPQHNLESGFMEDEVDQIKVDTLVLDTVVMNGINHDHQKPEVAEDTMLDADLNLQTYNTLEVLHPTAIQSLPENGGLDHEFSDAGSDFDAPQLGHPDGEDFLLTEKLALLSDKLDQELSEPSELSNLSVKPERMIDQINEEEVLQGKDSQPPSGGMESDSSPRSPFNQQEMPELNNHFSFSELQRSCVYDFDLPVYANDALAPNFPPLDPFTGPDEINLTDLPPLPPLPPVQWRLGKLQQSFSFVEEPMSLEDSSPQEIPNSTDSFSTCAASTEQSLVQMILPEMKEEKVEHSVVTTESIDQPPTSENHPKKQLVVVPSSEAEISATVEEESVIAAEVVLTQSSLSGINASHATAIGLQEPETESQNKQPVLPISDTETIPAEDNGVRSKSWLPSPLVNDASILDKSKLRKVTERARPELKKVDERDSFLQQIRTKSFNLRPAVPSRPSIRGPSTNLNVAAILEKANAIRQAFAGSDEDEDSWSDS